MDKPVLTDEWINALPGEPRFGLRGSDPEAPEVILLWAKNRRARLIIDQSNETISYDELAQRIGQPSAHRAVARANGQNRICILIPCHRVIGKDGRLSGYGGGVWRKRLLLNLERAA